MSGQDKTGSSLVAEVTQHSVPFLLRAARLEPGMDVLDIATGTGLAGRR